MSKEESKEGEKKVFEADARCLLITGRLSKSFSEGLTKGADKLNKSLSDSDLVCVKGSRVATQPTSLLALGEGGRGHHFLHCLTLSPFLCEYLCILTAHTPHSTPPHTHTHYGVQ